MAGKHHRSGSPRRAASASGGAAARAYPEIVGYHAAHGPVCLACAARPPVALDPERLGAAIYDAEAFLPCAQCGAALDAGGRP